MDIDVTMNSTRRLISSLANMPIINRFLVCTNIIIYNNQACRVMPYHTTIHLPQLI